MRLPVTFYPGSGPSDIYLASYKEWLAKQSVAANTLRVYHSRVKQFLLFLEYANLSDQAQSDLTGMNEAMRLYLEFLKESKQRDKSTINANVNALNSFSQFMGIEDSNLQREHCYEKATRVLTLDEQERFLRSVERQQAIRDKALAMVLFYTGLRIGDCARLNVNDIATAAACITLSDENRVALNNETMKVLKLWLEERSKLAGIQNESGLWLTKQGQRLTISGIAFVIKRIGWQAHLVVSTEMLRRTWLTKVTDHLSKHELAAKFGGYISVAAIKKHGVLLPVGPAVSALEH
jgi:site-specific recombinase XerD